MISRRDFLRASLGGGAALGLHSLLPLAGCGHEAKRNLLQLPREMSGTTLTATAAMDGSFRLGGALPAPTLRAQSGSTFSLAVMNQLGEPTNIHWHGLLVPADMDGHPKDLIQTGGSKQFSFAVRQRAGTYWYHPHQHMGTGRQIHQGMAGFYLVTDAEEQALGLPSGEFDVPLLLQDRRGEELRYTPIGNDMADGYLGDTPFVNGTPNPFFEVAAARYRLRLLNAANARIFKLTLADQRPFHLIATDGGLLASPVETTSLLLGPGERAEILVDFSRDSLGSSVMLQSAEFTVGSGGGHGGGHGGHGSSSGTPQGAAMDLVRFDVKRQGPAPGALPSRLASLDRLDMQMVQRTRRFVLGMREGVTEGMHTINDKLFEMARVDEQVPAGTVELWEFQSTDAAVIHPMHMHGMQFQVLSRSSGPLGPSDQGWKDTTLVFPMETVRLLVRIGTDRGLFLLHCHTLEHGDDGMMLNVELT